MGKPVWTYPPAGREGPIVHIGSSIGSAVGQVLQVSPKRLRTFVACGSAAGIAATFNAPIAGALFAMEVVLGDPGRGEPVAHCHLIGGRDGDLAPLLGRLPSIRRPRIRAGQRQRAIPVRCFGCARRARVRCIQSHPLWAWRPVRALEDPAMAPRSVSTIMRQVLIDFTEPSGCRAARLSRRSQREIGRLPSRPRSTRQAPAKVC